MGAYDPKKAAEKQVANAKANVQSYIDGVSNNTVHPGKAAMKAKGKMREKLMDALKDGGSFDQGCQSYTLEEWNKRTAEIGGRNWPQGLEDNKDKTEAFHEQLSDYLATNLGKVQSMKTDTLDQSLEKMKANAIMMSKFRFKKARR